VAGASLGLRGGAFKAVPLPVAQPASGSAPAAGLVSFAERLGSAAPHAGNSRFPGRRSSCRFGWRAACT